MYSLSKHWRLNKPTVICCALAIVVQVMQPFIGMLMPKIVIDNIEAQSDMTVFITSVGGLMILLILVSIINSYTSVIVNDAVGVLALFDETDLFIKKEIDMDFELLEDPDVKKVFDQAQRVINNNHTMPNNIPRYFVNVLVNLFGLLLYGSAILTVHPLIVLLLIVTVGINWLFLTMARNYYDSHRAEESDMRGKFTYLLEVLLRSDYGKDIRMFSMHDWLYTTYKKFVDDTVVVSKKINWRNTRASLADAALLMLRDGIVYAFLVYLFIKSQINIGNFIFIFAAISGFTGWGSGLIQETSDLLKASSEMNDARSFYAIKDRFNRGTGIPVELNKVLSIRFDNVSYSFPNAGYAVIENINLDIKPGERIAIVGANGAGKTTLIKLLCGLYRPKTGSIEINSIDSMKYNRDEYYAMFSAVFQDINILAENIAQNVSQEPLGKTDISRVTHSLKLSGLYHKVQGLPEKENTMLVKSIHEDGTEFSGGELQKLALARALYKNAPIIVLDEPTAALDPIAEREIYERYAELTEGRTSIYISHRLASTRFCDRILFLDNHGIAEQGSHEELMAQKGKYAEMFTIQAQYYNEEVTV